MLLRNGAAHVVAVDVGYGQLAWSLRTDERVTVLDRTNVRDLTPEAIGGPVELVVGDLSFISLRLVLPALAACATPEADLALMVKPQFEVGRERLGSGGVVRDVALHAEAVRDVAAAAAKAGLGVRGVAASPLPGPAGNVEYFLWLRADAPPLREEDVARAIEEGPAGDGRFERTAADPTGSADETRTSGSGATNGRRGVWGRADGTRRAHRAVGRPHRPAGGPGRRARHGRAAVGRGVGVRVLAGEAGELETDAPVCAADAEALEDIELVVVLGGDGTMLRGAEVARSAGVPAAGREPGPGRLPGRGRVRGPGLRRGPHRRPRLHGRGADDVDVEVSLDGQVVDRSWALNEASVEKASRERMLEVLVSIDGRPLSKWGCDGVIFATPTGSTAYNFSAGGPIVWPDLDALLLVPISAHALFARPLVVSPHSLLALELQPNGDDAGSKGAVMWCDGRRVLDLPAGARVEVRRGALPVRFARLHRAPFTDRLVAKFALPVDGWRVEK